MRGGVSVPKDAVAMTYQSSPHAWGCFPAFVEFTICGIVFPTCVGVFLEARIDGEAGVGLPHMRGGVSINSESQISNDTSSPHAWGCFY